MSMMTSKILQLSRRVRRVALQIERLCGEKVKVAYNVQQTASMVSNRICDRLDTKAIGYQLLKLFINLTRRCYSMILCMEDEKWVGGIRFTIFKLFYPKTGELQN
jgi:hypothetical protein